MEQEAHLVNHIKKMCNLGYGYTRVEVADLATNYAIDLGLKDRTDKPLSLQWFRSFMDRWPDIKLQRPRALSLSRAKSASKEAVDLYFNELEYILDKYDLKNKPQCIYNIDEKGISPEHSPPKVVGDAQLKSSVITSEKDKTTTIIAAGNAMGTQIPPFLVFAGQRFRQELLQGCVPGTSGDVSPSGWSNSDIFKTYLQTHFLNYVQGLTKDQPILVIFDGHKSHVSISVIDWAKANNIILLVLPAHTSHLLQPLDVGCFGPLNKIYHHSCHKFMRENHCKITKYNVGELCTNAYVKALSFDNLKASFRRTGIFPFDKSPYPPQVYLPSTVYTETDEQIQDMDSVTDEQNDIPQTPEQTDRIDSSPPMDEIQVPADSPPMDLSPDILTQVPVDAPCLGLSPDLSTQAPAYSPPMDLSPDIFHFLDDPDFDSVVDKPDKTCDGQDESMTLTNRPMDTTETDSSFFQSLEKGLLGKTLKKNNRKYLSKIVSGKAITEENIIKCVKEHCQSAKAKSTSKSVVNKKQTGKCINIKKQKNDVKQKRGVKSSCNKIKCNSSVAKPSTSGLQVVYISDSEESLFDHESQMSQSELCCVCNKFYPEKLKECGDLTIAKWGQCMYNECSHWVHLRFCCEIRVLRTHSVFYCPCHGLPCLQEE